MKYALHFVLASTLLFVSAALYADTFVVTSNADSGPGSLREAITLANNNGTNTVDHIHFNFSDQSREGRTIRPLSPLPALSSNLVIDGTTQNGASIGVSDAKVILLIDTYQSVLFTFFSMTNVSNVEIYGLYLFNDKFTLFSNYAPVDGIYIENCSNIVIGAPGKGNHFRGLYRAVYAINASGIQIRGNVFNHDENGDPDMASGTNWVNPMEYAIYFYNVKDILIGGDTPEEGNAIWARNIYIKSNEWDGNGKLVIQNNFFSTKTDGSVAPSASRINITIWGKDDQSDYEVSVKDNRINGSVTIGHVDVPFKIQGNTIFNDIAGSGGGSSDIWNLKIAINSCRNGGLIGGDGPGEGNEIYVQPSPSGYTNGFYSDHGAIFSNSPGVAILNNKMYCTSTAGSTIKIMYPDAPHVQVDHYEDGFVRGKATPGSRIQVFKDDDCPACDGIELLGETTSSPDGNWSFTGSFTGVVIATATKNGSTSGYTAPTCNMSDVKITQPTCGLNNGAISGITILHSVDNVEWHKTFARDGMHVDSIISRELDIDGLEPGEYYFIARLGETCNGYITRFSLRNYTPAIHEDRKFIDQPSCGLFNGSIHGIRVEDNDFSVYQWIDENRNMIKEGAAMDGVGIDDLPEGKYKLIVTSIEGGCSDSTDWYTLTNQSGPVLNLQHRQIVAATCGEANGSITGITVNNPSGDAFVAWVDSEDNIVAHSFDLTDQPAGRYKLKYIDESGCDTIITTYFSIPTEGLIVVDTTGKKVIPAGCTVANGAILDISTTGADSWVWVNTDDQSVVAHTQSVKFLPAGNYQLSAGNQQGCTVSSPVITVPTATFTAIEPVNPRASNASCGQDNGSIQIDGFTNNEALAAYKWMDHTGGDRGSSTLLSALGEGIYQLVATDTNGCVQSILTKEITVNARPSINLAGLNIRHDQCELHYASISGITVSGLANAPVYTWYNEQGAVVGTGPDLKDIGEGGYRLTISDGPHCNISSEMFEVTNDNSMSLPDYDNAVIAMHTAASLNVKNHREGQYQLYADNNGTQLLDENSTGYFITPPLSADRDFYIKTVNGACVSALKKVSVTVVDKSEFAVPTAFTPNNDKLNDILHVNVLGHIDLEYFRVYNRFGQQVFFTNNLTDGWDGKVNGVDQPAGVFIWQARGKDILGNIIEAKGSVMLIK